MSHRYNTVIVGSGPNGFAAAIILAEAGWRAVVYEANEAIGGGARSAALTLPGFLHDVCSAVHPLALASPFFRRLPLAGHGLRWIHSSVPLAHPLENGQAVVLHRSINATAEELRQDGESYRKLMEPLVRDWHKIENSVLGPLRLPEHPFALARFGLSAFQPARNLAQKLFKSEQARALFAGLAAHSSLPLEMRPSVAFGLILGLAAHAVGWPIPEGGSQKIADALASYLRSLGGEIVTGSPVRSLDDLPPARAILCDLTPRQMLEIARTRFPAAFRRKLEGYRYGPAAYKLDWALNGPIPWSASACRLAATVHLGGTLQEIAASERRARIHEAHCGEVGDEADGLGTAQCQLGGRGHQWRGAEPGPGFSAAHEAPLSDTLPGALSLLFFDSARRRRARDVRLFRGESRVEGSLIKQGLTTKARGPRREIEPSSADLLFKSAAFRTG